MTTDSKNAFQMVKVYVRPRPLTKNEIELRTVNIIRQSTARELSVKMGATERHYNYDQVFNHETTQAEIYHIVVSPLVDYIIKGYNCTVFAYGQTGTGKTHTMIGAETAIALPDDRNESMGMIPRAASHIFSEMSRLNVNVEYTVRVSFIEIYNEEVRDILSTDGTQLRIYDDPDNKGSVCVKGAIEQTVCNVKEVMEWLNKGLNVRQTAATNLNRQSSRSHSVFTFWVHTRESTVDGEVIIKSGKLHLVDLAGSENIGRSGATDVRAREAGTINRSLLTLGKVIKSLAQKIQHVPYRDSKLTRILQDSLGGKTKTCMIATFSPAGNAFDETLSTLDYAQVARSVANCPTLNVNRKRGNILKDLNQEIATLHRELSAARSGEGFYVDKQRFQEIHDDLKKKSEAVLILGRRIEELEEENTRLNTSFARTHAYLTEAEFKLKQEKIETKHKDKALDHIDEFGRNVTTAADQLLEVCNVSTTNELLYHQKYHHLFNSNQKTVEVEKELVRFSNASLKKVQALGESSVNRHEQHKKQAKESIQGDSSVIQQLTEELLSSPNLAFLKLSEMVNTGGIIESLKEQFQIRLTKSVADFGNLKQILVRLESHHLETRQQSEQISTEQLSEIQKSFQEREANINLLGDALQKHSDNLNKQVEERRLLEKKNEEFRNDIMTCLAKYDQLQKEYTVQTGTLEESCKKVEDIRIQNQYFQTMNEQQLKDIEIKLKSNDNLNREGYEAQNVLIKSGQECVCECEQELNRDLSSTQNAIEGNLQEMFSAIQKDLDTSNDENLNAMLKIKEKVGLVLETYTKSTDVVTKHLDEIEAEGVKWRSDTQTFVQQSLEYINRKDQQVVAVSHAGDTPSRPAYQYPKTIQKYIPKNVLIEQFRTNGNVAESDSDEENRAD